MKRIKWMGAAALLLLICVLVACSAPTPISYERVAQNPISPVPLSCFVQDVSAEEILLEGAAQANRYLSNSQNAEQEAAQYIYACLMAEQTEIDLSNYQISVNRITPLFTDVINRNPDLFFVNSGISYSYTSSGYIVTLKPTYRMTGEQLVNAREACAWMLDEICKGVEPSWSDFEIALYLHDYLCLHFAYDTTYQIYDMYTFLTEGTGVCQAYTLTYTALLQRYGIQSDVAVSEQMNHIWNIVMLGGQPYHVDVTWDDPLPDMQGRALHANFLRSDAGISETGHYAWVSESTCTSDVYDRTFLVNVEKPFGYTSGHWFYADGALRAILAADFTTMRQETVLEIQDKWLSPNQNAYYVDAFVGAGTYRGNLIYNTPKQIWAYNLQSGVTVEIKVDLPRGLQIFDLWVDGDTVHYSVSNAPDGKMQTQSIHIAELADYLLGDADQNGVVDGRDVTAILRYLEGLPTVCHIGASDLDDSGTVDARDVQILRQLIVENH